MKRQKRKLTVGTRDVHPAVVVVGPERGTLIGREDRLVLGGIVQTVTGELLAVPVLVHVEVRGLVTQDASNVDVLGTVAGATGKAAECVDKTILAIDCTMVTIDGFAVFGIPPLSGGTMSGGISARSVDDSNPGASQVATLSTRTVIASEEDDTLVSACFHH